MNITFVIDDNYIEQLLFVIYQCKVNASRDHTYWVFFESLSEKNVRRVQQIANELRVEINLKELSISEGFFDVGHISRASLIRLLVPELFRDAYVHLDVDILPLRGWDKIETVFPNNNEILVARKHPAFKLSDHKLNQAFVRAGEDYFQAGVMILNPKVWKKKDVNSLVKGALEQYNDMGFEFSDQCILNYVLFGHIKFLPEYYNHIANEFSRETSRIVHFAGPDKPWNSSIFWISLVRIRSILGIKSNLKLIFKGKFKYRAEQNLEAWSKLRSEILSFIVYKVKFSIFQNVKK